ncbi:Hypothetical protein I596_2187 [Dokdonella koreensis DS-123]|uniref:Uncharacterized protein n=1 Tax=Dokdonella koreensis DS-123 TaxID=1300342 RepID=A0A160DUQ2_9GAMM|nr:Hypothetical protein I596_2187 [Dokdonella koreensis DS-123]
MRRPTEMNTVARTMWTWASVHPRRSRPGCLPGLGEPAPAGAPPERIEVRMGPR